MLDHISVLFEFSGTLMEPVDSVRNMLKQLNPWNDPFVDRLHMLVHAAQRDWNARNGEFKTHYWDMLPAEDRLVAEAESAWLEDCIHDLIALRANYICQTYLLPDWESDPEAFCDSIVAGIPAARKAIAMAQAHDAEAFARADSRGQAIATDTDYWIRFVQNGAALQLMPISHPATVNDFNVVTQPVGGEREYTRQFLRVPATEREASFLRRIRTVVNPVCFELATSWGTLLDELVRHGDQRNKITGVQGNQHKLLINDDIPLPNASTWLGWFQHCGLAFRGLTVTEMREWKRICGFIPTHILTYTPPLMPMSMEHRSGSPIIGGEDSNIKTSLPSRSKGHARHLDSNRIDYGRWTVRTVLLNQNNAMQVVREEIADNNAHGLAIHERHLITLPNGISTASTYLTERVHMNVLLDSMSSEEAKQVTTPISTPESQNEGMQYWLWHLAQRTLAGPWESLSRFYGLHFRFDSDSHGKAALEDWEEAFMSEALRFISLNRRQRMRYLIDGLEQGNAYFRTPSRVVTVKRGGATQRFDFTGL